MFSTLVSSVLLASLLLGVNAEAQSAAWVVKKTQWTSADEKSFQDFIQAIGEAAATKKCRTTDSCLKSVANPFRNTDPKNIKFFSDCADLPYYLRTYFAWKNGLPLSFTETITALGGTKDIRYSGSGNAATKKKNIFTGANGLSVLTSVSNAVSSGTFRMEYDADSSKYAAPDFYPTRLSRDAIVPGTAIYDPAGHVAVVYKISDDGRVHYIDAHPDNSITSGIYTNKFARSAPRHGAGFKNWRPFKIVNASLNGRGEVVSGKYVYAKNSEIAGYGTEQFYGTKPDPAGWKQGKFLVDGKDVNYYDYVRIKLAKGNLVINPVEDFKEILGDICVAIEDRVPAVQLAITSKISQAGHPSKLPGNIYGTDGEWETYSSPSRDARLKTAFVDLLEQTKMYFEKIAKYDPTVVYKGTDLKADLRQAYAEFVPTCKITYEKSNGTPVTLDFEQIRKRLFDLSFDPYNCIELRWGATGEELSSCRDSDNKRQWYAREKWLRNQVERTYDAKMDYSLDQLMGPKPGAGVATAPDVDILNLLK